MFQNQAIFSCTITARQYGEVVLPDDSTGQGPGTLTSFAHRNDFSREGGKAVTVQGGYGALFAVMVQILLRITSVAVQIVSEPEIYHGAGFKLRADARVRVQRPLRICLGCRNKS